MGPNMLRIMEWPVGLLRKAGFPDQAAGYFGDMLGRYLDASVLEVTAQGSPPIEQVGAYFAGLPAERRAIELPSTLQADGWQQRRTGGTPCVVGHLDLKVCFATVRM